MDERVILVDEDDAEVGAEEKMRAHRAGLLHRAFSVFVFNARGEMLLQRRASGKYHSGGLWTNTCCSHPRPGEPTAGAARRRLREEMGLDCALEEAFAFVYRAELGPDLWEHEYDHVFVGRCEAEPRPDPEEVEGWRWATVEEVRREMAEEPEAFTVWFRIAFERLVEWAERAPNPSRLAKDSP